ncbi:MAG: nicotinamide riboside transporter PnuC [Bacteroidales bacterium]
MDVNAIFSTLHQNLLDTSYVEIIAVFFGLLSVWYARNENIRVYPTGLINVVLYVYIFYGTKLYANMGMNFYFVIMSVYGWYYWAKVDENQKHVPISRCSRIEYLQNFGLFTVSFVGLYFLLKNSTDSKFPIGDSITSAFYIVGMWLQTRKKIENWTFWIIGDLLAIPLCIYSGLIFSAFQFAVFLIIAISGYFEWKKKLVKNYELEIKTF